MGLVGLTIFALMNNDEKFCEYDMHSGIGDLLFYNSNLQRYRFYRVKNNWERCYVIEFGIEAKDYDSFFWGHIDDGVHRSQFFSFMSFLDNPSSKWKKVKIYPRQMAYNLEELSEKAEKEIEKSLLKENTNKEL